MIGVLGARKNNVFNQKVSGTVCCKVIWKYEYVENSQGRLIRTLFRGGAERPPCGAGEWVKYPHP